MLTLHFDLEVDLIGALLVASDASVGALIALVRLKDHQSAIALDVDALAGHERRRVGTHPGALWFRNANDNARQLHLLLFGG